MMGAWRPKHIEKVCSNKICILLQHVGVLFNLKHSTLSLTVDTRRKIIELKTTTLINFHWIKGLKGNERSDYLAKTVASYNPTITRDALPVSRGKQLLEDYYTKICNATYMNSVKASRTKALISLRLPQNVPPLPLCPNYTLTQLLTNHGCLRSFLHKMEKAPTPLCTYPEKTEKTARNLMSECSLFSKERPKALHTLLLQLIMQYRINTVDVSMLHKSIFHMLQDQSNATTLHNNSHVNTNIILIT